MTKEQLLVLFDYPNNHGSVESTYENVCFEILKSPVKPVRKHKASDKDSLSVTLTYKEKMKMIEIAQKKNTTVTELIREWIQNNS